MTDIKEIAILKYTIKLQEKQINFLENENDTLENIISRLKAQQGITKNNIVKLRLV